MISIALCVTYRLWDGVGSFIIKTFTAALDKTNHSVLSSKTHVAGFIILISDCF